MPHLFISLNVIQSPSHSITILFRYQFGCKACVGLFGSIQFEDLNFLSSEDGVKSGSVNFFSLTCEAENHNFFSLTREAENHNFFSFTREAENHNFFSLTHEAKRPAFASLSRLYYNFFHFIGAERPDN